MTSKKMEKRIKRYWLILMAIFVVLIARLATLQLLEAHAYRTQSQENIMRIIPIRAPRGEIMDRNGTVLARNKQVFSVTYMQDTAKIDQVVVQRLADILQQTYPEITAKSISEQIDQHQKQGKRYEPVLIKRDIDMAMITILEEARQELPRVSIVVEPIRDYPLYQENTVPLAGHLLGFVREINANEIAQRNQGEDESKYYRPQDLIGKDGLEKFYEEQLRGQDGLQQVEVNTYNRPQKYHETLPAKVGNSLVLTIDLNLQEVMEKSMDETLAALQKKGISKAQAGAGVLIDVNTGKILAMVSRPNLNPNDFIGTMSQELASFYYKQDNSGPSAAVNHAIAGTYPPGSTFKPVTALAALESRAVLAQTRLISCTGIYPIKPYIKCTGVHGLMDLTSGMAKSCNVYFQEAARLAGEDLMAEVGDQLGLGTRTGVDLPGESKGTLPSPTWKKELNEKLLNSRWERQMVELDQKYADLIAQAPDEKTRTQLTQQKERERKQKEAQHRIDYNFATTWQQYDTFNMSIGQGNNNYTPLQLANYISTVVNGGRHFQPYLVDRIINADKEVVFQTQPTILNQLTISSSNLDSVRRAMRAVMQPGGTAYSLFADFPASVTVGGKTGTAQTGRAGDAKNKDAHGVFVAFAPAENPEVAFAGIIEYGDSGSTSAGLVARAVLQEYFGLNQPPAVVEEPPVTPGTPLPEEGEQVFIEYPYITGEESTEYNQVQIPE